MVPLPPDELEDLLFIAMLELSRAGADPEFDLVTLCSERQIIATPTELLRFTSDNDVIRGSSSNTHANIRFTMNADGWRHALQIEKSRKPKLLLDPIRKLPFGKGLWDVVKIGLGALLGFLGAKYSGKI